MNAVDFSHVTHIQRERASELAYTSGHYLDPEIVEIVVDHTLV